MRKTALLFLGIVVILILLNAFGIPVAGVVRQALQPAGGWLTDLGRSTRSKIRNFNQLDSFSQENAQLREENNELKEQLVDYQNLSRENAQLREELAFKSSFKLKLVGADIINFQPDATRELIRVNRGGRDGVKEGTAVVTGGSLVGIVKDVNNSYSDVLLLGDVNFRALTVAGTSRATGVIKGQIGSNLSMERIPQDENIEIGSLVTTSGLDGVFPPNLLIGRVASVSQTPGGVFQSAQVVPQIDTRRLQTVMIVLQ